MDTEVREIISFDFDKTLELEWVQTNLFAPLSQIYDVVVITSRSSEKENKRLWEITEKLGIPKDNVYFTSMQSKSEYVDIIGCVLHFDDDFVEIHDINESCKCKGVLINYMMNSVEFRTLK